MPGRLDHPDLGLGHQLAQVADGADVHHPVFRRDHHEGGFAPAAEERPVIPGDAVAQPLASGAPVRPVLIIEVHLGIVGIDAGAFNQEALVEI